MKHRLPALAVAAAILAGPAWGQQLQNTYVSGKGADSGNCPLTTPCRSFQYALSQTQTGGTLSALDTAGYGAVIIERAVTITAPPGVVAVATATSGPYSIFVGNAVTFHLEGLTLDGTLYVDSVPFGLSSFGTIERCTIRSGGAQFQNGGAYEITDSTIVGDVIFQAIRFQRVNASILRTRISGWTTVANGADGIDFGETDITDSFLGGFGVSGNVGVAYTVRMVRSRASGIGLSERSVAYLTGSTIDQLSIQDQAVAKSSGDNDIINVSGNLQPLAEIEKSRSRRP